MTRRLLLTPKARADLLDISDYISRDSPRAAERLLGRFEKTSLLLTEQPDIGHLRSDIRRPEIRCFAIGYYLVFYRTLPDGIEIVRYLHGRRDLKQLL